jgi:hypothetical protein
MTEEHWSPRCRRPDNLVAPVPVDPTGERGPTKRQATGHHQRRTSSGLYVPSAVDAHVVEQRVYEQGHRIRSVGAVSGWAALRWRGAAYFDGLDSNGVELPVPLVVGNHPLQPDPRIRIDRSQIAPTERLCTAGIWVATVQRALFDVMRFSPHVRDAVVAMDMAAAARLISVCLMSQYVVHRSAWTGVPLVREALALATNDSRSPQESRMRLVWILDARLPMPLCNVPIFDLAGRLLAVPDLFDPVAGQVGEYDGVDHKSIERHRADVAREGLLRRHGLEYFAVVGGDLPHRSLVVRRMYESRDRALFQAPDQRTWTLTPPPWWRPREEPLDIHLLRIGAAPYLVRT